MTEFEDTMILVSTEKSAAALVDELASLLIGAQWKLATAESCTGGMIAAACTDLAGSSVWFERGFVTYSNAAKIELLGVSQALTENPGAVSEPVVRAMAQGAISNSKAQISLAVTGVAGPTGGSIAKPVGTGWFGFATPQGIVTEMRRFKGDRAAVRSATVVHALQRMVELVAAAAAKPP